MGRIVGIDLGTTYSAVTIPEEGTGEGFLLNRECPGCSVILDPLKRPITPSVVAEDSNGNIVVGHSAKARAGLSPEPIMFAKRYMGEDKTFQLDKQGTLRPEDVSAHILRHLKHLAEERLGEVVEEAVITVPAYFSLKAKHMTEKAGEIAGLRVAQIAQEPVAAALMYCLNDPRDPLRVMTYDLGGGTFDIAILEKRDDTISSDSILAFDGDRFLGGYNFDKRLALWIMDHLIAQGYNLQLDLDNPADKVIFAKLMVYAERAKIALSESEYYEFQEPSTGIKDHNDRPVTIEGLGIQRDEFEIMIEQQVEYTLALCHRAMSKVDPPIEKNQFDELLMVGGSSRIPMIARRLEEEFGHKPKLVDPEICVALGAAIIAGTKPPPLEYLRLDPVPKETDESDLTVTGRVEPGDSLQVVGGCRVILRAMDGSYQSNRTTGAGGAFVFEEVPLTPGDRTDFVLSVTSPASVDVATHLFSVVQTNRPRGGLVEHVPNVLSKPISILFEDGLQVIAPARTPLPYETIVNAETRDISGKIRVPIREGNNPLGEILMPNIPTTLPIGSTIEITLNIQENYQIHGRAKVPALSQEETVVINIPIPEIKSLDQLRREFEGLVARGDDALRSTSRGVRFTKAKPLEDSMGDVKEMLQSRDPDPYAIQDRLDEIESLIREIGVGWRPEPPRKVFEHMASQTRKLYDEAIKKKPEIARDGYDRQLEAIRIEAEKAYLDQHAAAWKESYERLVKLCDTIRDITDNGDGPPPDPKTLLLLLGRDLADLQDWAKDAGRGKEFKDEFDALAEDLKQIDPSAPNAINLISDWYHTKFADLKRRLKSPVKLEIDDGLVRRV